MEYHKNNMFEDYERLLKKGLMIYNEYRKKHKVHLDVNVYVTSCLSLALFYCYRFTINRDEKLIEQATIYLNDAESESPSRKECLLVKAYIKMLQNQFDEALSYLLHIPSKTNLSIPACILSCLISCKKGNFFKGFEALQKALLMESRVTIFEEYKIFMSYILTGLKLHYCALSVLEGQITSNKSAIDAFLSCAVLILNYIRHGNSIKFAMNYFKKAYEMNKNNSISALHLANYFFKIKNNEKSWNLLKIAEESEYYYSKDIKSEILFIKAKFLHSRNEYDHAFLTYSDSIHQNASMILSHFGLGQLFIKKKDYNSAHACFKRIIELNKGDPDTQLFNFLLSIEEQNFENMNILQEKLLTNPEHRFEFFSGISLISTNKEQLLDALKNAYALSGKRFDAYLFNNFAVAFAKYNEFSNAIKYFNHALELAETREMYNIALYNLARCYEFLSHENSRSCYEKLLESQEDFIECHLRLGLINSDYQNSLEHLKNALGYNDKYLESWILIGYRHLKSNALLPARKALEKALHIDPKDSMTCTLLGYVFLELYRSKRALKQDRSGEWFKSNDFFTKALQFNRENVFAAIGLGISLAEKGYYDESRKIFSVTRSFDLTNAKILINLGHCFTELGKWQAALQIYDIALKKDLENQDILLLISRTLYLEGKHDGNIDAFNKALDILARLNNKAEIRMNKALCFMSLAKVSLSHKQDRISSLEKIKEYISISRSLIDSIEPDFISKYSGTKRFIYENLEYCMTIIENLNQ